MATDDGNGPLSRVDPSRRKFLKGFLGAAFAVPVVATFALDGVASADTGQPEQRFGNQSFPNQHHPRPPHHEPPHHQPPHHEPPHHFPNQHFPRPPHHQPPHHQPPHHEPPHFPHNPFDHRGRP